MLSAVNQVFAAELCCLQGIRFSLPNLCGSQRIRCSLPNWCGPQRIKGSLPNSVVRSDSGVRYRIVLSAANQLFAAEFVLATSN